MIAGVRNLSTSLSILALFLATSCVSTQRGYSADREFPVEASPLKLKIDYASEKANGTAKAMVILGFIRLGDSEFAYPNGAGGLLGGLPLVGGGNGSSIENAAVYKVLSATESDVLGFPMFTKRVTNYYLWQEEECLVSGYPGKVSR